MQGHEGGSVLIVPMKILVGNGGVLEDSAHVASSDLVQDAFFFLPQNILAKQFHNKLSSMSNIHELQICTGNFLNANFQRIS